MQVDPNAVNSIDQYWQRYTPAVVSHVQVSATDSAVHTPQQHQQQQQQQHQQQCASVSAGTSSDSSSASGCASHAGSTGSVKTRTDTLYKLIRASEILQQLHSCTLDTVRSIVWLLLEACFNSAC
jgi:transcription initiation factor TFIID subunit TAF12